METFFTDSRSASEVSVLCVKIYFLSPARSSVHRLNAFRSPGALSLDILPAPAHEEKKLLARFVCAKDVL